MRKLDSFTKRKYILVFIICAVIFAIVGLFTYIWSKNKSETIRNEIEYHISTLNGTYKSTKDWTNGAWLGTLDKDKVHSIQFVTAWSGKAQQAWVFDGIYCYYTNNIE